MSEAQTSEQLDPALIQRALDCPCPPPAGIDGSLSVEGFDERNCTTVRAYLGAIMLKVWDSGDGFDSKRPFGFSGWRYDILWALGEADLIESERDEGSELVTVDREAGNRLIRAAIRSIGTEL